MSDERVGLMAEKSAWKASARRAERLTGLYSLLGLLLIPAFMIPAEWLASRLTAGLTQDLLASTFVAVVAAPMVLVMWRNGATQQGQTIRLMDELERQLTSALDDARSSAERREAQARRQEFETRLASALEMADGESEVIDVVERALTTTLPGAPAELLLADNSHAHLTRMAVSSGPGSASGPAGSLRRAGPMCGVDSPDHCPAARRSQVQHFGDSDALDACPKLQRRAEGRIAALCVPVSIMGRTVGVIHTTAEPQTRFEDEVVQDVSTLANLAGARLGLLRMVADTQLQAATDSLTGLLNRRSLENKVRALREADVSYTVVMADLDHFKHLNDTHGHETGDRALRLFARTLRSSVRSQDLVSRHGGEEFAVVLAGCSADD
ncbi:MAG TPA: sensor domain-containing diguanylate cyclase, partial [Acidimicrobiales bacterium]